MSFMHRFQFSKLVFNFLLLFPFINRFSSEEAFLLINGETNKIILELGSHINERISPCSTFKIALSLMGYDSGILKNENSPSWDFLVGYDDWLASWRASQTPQSWMQYSCIWYSKVLSLQLGLEKIESYLTSMKYGNMDMSGGLAQPGPENVAWVNSSLKISPKEQVDFIRNMIQNKLPISTYACEMTKTILFKEQLNEGWKLFGKTGWSGSNITKDGKTLEHSWFLGWIEKDHHFFPFVYLILDKKIDLDQRIPRVKQLLMQSNVMVESNRD